MKKILLLISLLLSLLTFAQNNGITYQAVIYSTGGESIPGIHNSNSPLVNKSICLQFGIIDENTQIEYQEKVAVTTDDFGMVNLVIGNGTQTGGYTSSFNAIDWSNSRKNLKVSLDESGSCSNFYEISNQVLTYVPYALAANSAATVSGVVSIAHGGTNASTLTGAKTNLQLQNVDNTSDLNKPLSTATLTALSSKVDKVVGKDLSSNDYTTVEKTKLATISGVNTGDQDLSSYATNTALAAKVDKVSGKELSSNDYTTVEKTKLAAISGVNTGDQDLSLYATNTALAAKVDKVAGKDLSTNDFTTAEKTKLASLSTTAGVPYSGATGPVNLGNYDLKVNGLTIGKGTGQNDQNTAIGAGALNSSVANGTRNTAVGYLALKDYRGTSFDNNTGVGYFNMVGLTTGYGNTSIGAETMFNVGSASNNTGIGNQSLINASGNNNVGVGARSGDGLTTGSNNTFIGTQARTESTTGTISNSTAIGSEAVVTSSNTIQLGNTNVSSVKTSGTITATGFKTPSGTISQFLKADGSVDTNSYVSSNTDNIAIGYVAGTGGQGVHSIAIGSNVAQGAQAEGAVGVGYAAAQYNQGENAVAIGKFAGQYNQAANSVAIGADTQVSGTNSVALGTGASVSTDNTIQLGNTSVTDVKTSGTLTAGAVTYPNIDGTNGQVLTTNGNGNLTWTDKNTGIGTQDYLTKWASNTTTGSSIIYDNGTQIGIGTTSPTGIFEVSGSSSTTNDQYFGYANGNMQGVGLSWPGTEILQTFTAGISGNLSKISVFSYGSNNNVILKIYAGSNSQGALLYTSTPINFVNGVIIDMNISNIVVTTGQTYTFQLQSASNIMLAGSSGPYQVSNGTTPKSSGSGSTFVNPGYGDITSSGGIFFNTYVTTLSGSIVFENNGNLKTNGSITATSFKTPSGTSSQYLMADGSVSSSTLSNYLPLSGGNLTGQLSMGTSSPQSSAVLDVSSTTQGFLPPRMTQDQRNGINNPVAGLVVWCKNCGENGELQVFNGTNWSNLIGGSTLNPLVVGSSYKGGKIAYIFQSGDPGYVAGEFHGIIASNADLSNGIRWGQNNDGLSTTYDCTNRHGSSGYALPCAIGAGRTNTSLIISSNTEVNPTDYAAKICDNYSIVYNGVTYDDWFLPSYNEMLKLYQNKNLIGGLFYDSTNSSSKSNWYWTSTGDVFQDRAADVNSNDGSKARNFRGYLLSVRAVRYF